MGKFRVFRWNQVILVAVALMCGSRSLAVSLDDYLNQVKQESLGYKASAEQTDSAELKSREADLFFTPRFFADARIGYDGKYPFASTISYDRIRMQSYSLGVSQEFSFGLQSKLSYAVDRLELVNPVFTSGAAFTAPQTYWRAAPYLELSMPLWGGGFGRVSQATEELTRQQNVAEKLGSQAQGLGLLVEAEATYWRLSSAREIVQVQSQALKQAQGILDYVSRKARMNLGENADVLQAKALVEARTFQLQQAQNQERAARRAFNVLLNKPAEAPVESLQSLQYDSIAKTEVPTAKPGDRFDVQAAAAQSQLARSSAVLVAERNKPKVDLYGSYAIDGFDTNYDSASTKSFSAERDSAFVGVRLNMPLYVSAMGDAKAGALKAQRAAEITYQQKQFVQEQDWTNLVQQLTEAKESLRLATNIVNAQKIKVENERTRLRQGRTTTYQVLLFEQDFSQSEVARVQAAAQILGLQAQIKLYQTSVEGGK